MANSFNTADINAYPRLKKEMQQWGRWVRADIPALFRNVDLKIRCQYTEAYATPFKFKDQMLVSYGSSGQSISIRESEIDTILDELLSTWKSQNNSVENIVKDYPAYFVMTKNNSSKRDYATHINLSKYEPPKKGPGFFEKVINFLKGGSSSSKRSAFIGYFNLIATGKLEIGRATGKYYVDLYGYIWVEMRGNYQTSGANVICWVRWDAVDCKLRDIIEDLLLEKRDEVMRIRIAEEELENSTFSSVGEFVKSNALLLSAGALLLPILKNND